jgi:hypothetical protein
MNSLPNIVPPLSSLLTDCCFCFVFVNRKCNKNGVTGQDARENTKPDPIHLTQFPDQFINHFLLLRFFSSSVTFPSIKSFKATLTSVFILLSGGKKRLA